MIDKDTLAKRTGETDAQHHKRLVYGKLVDKTLSDYDYAELSGYVYGKQYAPDVARRMMYGSRKTLELLENDRVHSVTGCRGDSDLDDRIANFQKEKQKFYDQRREYNKLLASDARREHLYERLVNAANNLNETVGEIYNEASLSFCGDTDNEAVLVFSDWHYGMVAENVFNKYDTDVCVRRIKNVVNNAAKRIVLHGCSRLHIVVLGDLFHGAIHNSARVASEELVCDQIMQVSEILAQSIEQLCKYVTNTTVYITYGNHGRTVQNKNDSIHRDNIERLIPWWLEQRLAAYKNLIEFKPDSCSEFLFIKAAGHEICASHGDIDTVKGSPRLLATLFRKRYGKDIEFVLLGDKHHRQSFEEMGVTSLLCGALCGTDDYANDKRLYSIPSQLLLIFNPRDGLDAEYRIKCV